MLPVESTDKLAFALTYVKCLVINAFTKDLDDVSALIDIVKALKVARKDLFIFNKGIIEPSSLLKLNKSINFNVVFKQSNTVLCPAIGKEYPELHHGTCPPSIQTLVGRHLRVSFIGIEPYIKRTRPPSGSDVSILEVIAKKLGFSFELIPARGFDIAEINGTKVGMMHRASIIWREGLMSYLNYITNYFIMSFIFFLPKLILG